MSLTEINFRFRLGHVPGSLNLPHQHGFQPDGSLTPSPSSSSLTSARGRSVVVVVANKGESGPVVRAIIFCNITTDTYYTYPGFCRVCIVSGAHKLLIVS